MDIQFVTSQLKKLSSDNSLAKIDLTLRLGQPYHSKHNHSGQNASQDNTSHNFSNKNFVSPYNQAMENCKTQSDQQVNEDAKKWSCHRCGTMKTPSKRKGPDGPKTLCNACGLRYSRVIKKGKQNAGNKNNV